MSLNGKKAIVTGGSRGIGFAIARALTEKGAQVLITGRHEDTLREAAEKLGAEYLVWDTAEIEKNEEMVSKAEKLLSGLDVLVNNAGIHRDEDFGGMLAVTPESWDETMNVNLRGTFFLTQTVAKRWIEEKHRGRIVNICSNNAFRAKDTAYAASKWAIRGLTVGMAKRLAPYGIIMNAVAPGPTSTTMLSCEDGETRLHGDAPIGRFSYPSEIASLVTFLASDETENIVGQVIVADGGELLT